MLLSNRYMPFLPQKIVYVSCNPSTFARDAGVLFDKGYKFKAAGIMNMFAQTLTLNPSVCLSCKLVSSPLCE